MKHIQRKWIGIVSLIVAVAPQQKLFPGMNAHATLPSRQAENTIKVPNAALRFKPELSPDKLQQVYAASGIRNASHRAQQGIVWRVANEGKLVHVQIATGLTDHVNTAVTKVIAGSLNS